jgi:hypothetical protein
MRVWPLGNDHGVPRAPIEILENKNANVSQPPKLHIPMYGQIFEANSPSTYSRIFPGLAHVPAAFCRELPIVAPIRKAKVFDSLDNRWWAL